MKNVPEAPGRSIAVIGGGASAVLLLTHLAEKARTAGSGMARLTITLFDRAGAFGKGIAYGTVSDSHLLNVRAANMSSLKDDPSHFAAWAAPYGITPSAFAPRALYGRYISAQLKDSIRILTASGHSVQTITADIIQSRKDGHGYILKDAAGHETAFDTVILASGNATALSLKGEALHSAGGYWQNPWTCNYKALASGEGTVILLGTGLSAVDAVVSLREAGFKGQIRALSRRGLLPQMHTDPVAFSPIDLMTETSWTGSRLLHCVRNAITDAAAQNIPWQAVIDSLRAQTNLVWAALSPFERGRIQKRLLPYWNVHRHRMAPEIAAIVEQARTENGFTILKDEVLAVSSAPGAGLIVKGRKGDWMADHVINCLGYAYGPEKGRVMDYTHALGPPLFGLLLETTAIPEIRAQAAAIADEIAGSR